MNLKTLIEPLVVYQLSNEGDPLIQSLEMDSRQIREGSLFFCIKGYTVDGHDFAKQAVAHGAVAIVAERDLGLEVPTVIVGDPKRVMAQLASRFYGEPSKAFRLIGVTGTNGKTTITHLLEKMMQDAGQQTGLIGTMYTKVKDKTYETKNTTPESLQLQKRFFEMKEAGVDTAVMEVSSHALYDGRVRGCDFDVAIFTNLTPDHLDYHKTMEEYKYAKGLLFAQLGNTYNGKIAILNQDDPASLTYDKMTTAQVVTYGLTDRADVYAKDVKIAASKTTFTLVAFQEEIPISLQLIGMFSVYNALAAAAAALVSGVSLQQVKKSLEAVKGVAGRFETVNANQPFTVIVDYAHTPDSLENVLKTVNELAKGKVCVVVGCGGDRDRTKRPVMAKIACQLADYAIFTSDNPRSEDPSQILSDMKKGIEGDNYVIIEDRKQAIYHAIQEAKEEDVIVIAGKGHETYQILKDRTIDFDDRAVARQAIEERGI
ncbi:UDP-N-acetylmuramoyl-L-alanyl-D-glutamate--2,6-diaminopimelate ligase [Halalkalibacterium ligniniphilum]|uniref:UDP-N-acetylmuramoyl-L-alanyl-D-glutamate--2, 6-diaminopimelate ligase n=1 Tax=Halalkalibacterium ligniniphilum TaxID=1134413 RepID=UPI0003490EBA|nr:UDP-N-acetylmuramoyl-L-alanyl-D-glutamate--2,6-diaminopimelate ligase [Halalkalibacterium ligniniphilum]